MRAEKITHAKVTNAAPDVVTTALPQEQDATFGKYVQSDISMIQQMLVFRGSCPRSRSLIEIRR
jgi:hypothetical protein